MPWVTLLRTRALEQVWQLLQPFLAGGVITVVAPLAVASWGLPLWTAACLAVVVLAGSAGLLLARLQAPAP